MGDGMKILRCFFRTSNPRESYYTLPPLGFDWPALHLLWLWDSNCVDFIIYTAKTTQGTSESTWVFLTRNRGCDVPITPSFVCFITELQKSGKIVTWNCNPFRAFLALNSWTSPPINGDLNEAGETRVTFYLQHWIMRSISSQISRTFL